MTRRGGSPPRLSSSAARPAVGGMQAVAAGLSPVAIAFAFRRGACRRAPDQPPRRAVIWAKSRRFSSSRPTGSGVWVIFTITMSLAGSTWMYW